MGSLWKAHGSPIKSLWLGHVFPVGYSTGPWGGAWAAHECIVLPIGT